MSALASRSITVHIAPDADPLEARGAKDLCKYLRMMAAQNFRIRRARAREGSGPALVVCESSMLGLLCHSERTAASLARGVPRHRDGYIVRSVEDGGGFLYLVGRTPCACMYACYDYLQSICGCGFFQDGEYVPRLDSPPVAGIDIRERPRFDNRMHLCWNAHRGIKRYHSFWWTLEDWKREFDWMARNRLNLVRLDMAYYSRFAGDAFQQAFPEIGREPDGVIYPRFAGWPTAWGWRPSYRRKLTQRLLQYGRSLGIRFIYAISYGGVPLRFREVHPEYDYMPGNQYGESHEISPYDPNACEVERRHLAKIVELFGTDHLYMCTPYAEIDVGAGSMKKNLDVRIKAGRQVLKLIRDVDPDGTWVTDTWDMIDSGQRWNPTLVGQYLGSFPKSRMLLYETAADVEPLHDRFGGWHGKEWAFGVLHSFAGKDSLHGNAAELIGRVRNVAENSRTCTGLFMVPEMTHANIMFWDLVTRLAWQPKGIELWAFVKTFVRRRYGRESAGTMYEAWRRIVETIYSRPAGEIWSYVYGEHPWFQWPGDCPLYDGRKRQLRKSLRRFERELPPLREAMGIMLGNREALGDHPLYVEDVVVLFRDIAAKRFNQEAAAVFEAFREGRAREFEVHRRRAISVLRSIESVLGLCPSYSINRTIDDACSVRGHNPRLPEMIRQACLNIGYVNQDVHEQFRGEYMPKTRACFAFLAREMKEGRRRLRKDDLKETFEAISARYRRNGWRPTTIPVGDPVAAVARQVKRIA